MWLFLLFAANTFCMEEECIDSVKKNDFLVCNNSRKEDHEKDESLNVGFCNSEVMCNVFPKNELIMPKKKSQIDSTLIVRQVSNNENLEGCKPSVRDLEQKPNCTLS